MDDVSKLVHMKNMQRWDFDMCRFGQSDKGPKIMTTHSPQVAQKGEPDVSVPTATSRKGKRHKDSGQHGFGSYTL